MKAETKQHLNEDLENMEKRFLLIAFSDPEQYRNYVSRLKALQEKLLGTSDLELEKHKGEIIAEIAMLQNNFEAYMDGYDQSPSTVLKMDEKIESGRAKLRTYKLNLYFGVMEDLKKLDYIDIEDIKKIKSQWENDKKNAEFMFSPFEISAFEEKLASLFVEYQIKYLQTRDVFSGETITDYVSLEEYGKSIKTKLLELSQNSDISLSEKAEIDALFNENDIEKLLKSPVLWRCLSSKKVNLADRDVKKIADKSSEKLHQNTEHALVVSKKKKNDMYMICTIQQENKFFNRGKIRYKQVKVKVKDGKVELPEKYKDCIVEAYIPEGAESIVSETFKGCEMLMEVHLPSTMKSIGVSAFKECVNLQKINLPDGLKIISDEAFYKCSSLKDINLPDSVVRMGEASFAHCQSLRKIRTPNNSQIAMGNRAFYGCFNLEEVNFSGELETIPDRMFGNCIRLSKIKFPIGLKTIGIESFFGCYNLTDLSNLPETLERIETNAFAFCQKLKKLKLPESLMYIGDASFMNCDKELEEVVLPRVLSYLGKNSFGNALKLKSVMMPEVLEDGLEPFSAYHNPDAVLYVPENPKGSFYKKLGINESMNISITDLRERVDKSSYKKRNDYLERFYGKNAYKTISDEYEKA